jgi:Putative porin
MKNVHKSRDCKWTFFIAILLILAASGLSRSAQAEDTVEDALRQLATALLQDPNLAPTTKKALTQVIDALESERMHGATPAATSGPVPESHESRKPKLEKFSFSGDLRLRHESNLNLDTGPDRHRQRLRLRLGGEIELTPTLKIGTRLVSGNPDNPKSTHQTLGNGFDSFDVSLDRVYVHYTPAWMENGWVTAGKFGDPFERNPIFDGLVWDNDVQPEGVAFGYAFDSVPGLDSVTFVLGSYVLQERSRNDNAYVAAGQVSIHKTLTDTLAGNMVLGYYSYSDLDMPDVLRHNGGNAVVDTNGDGTPDAFTSNFGILNPMASVTYTGWKKPITLSTEYMRNLRAQIADDTGWVLGIAVGTTKKRRDWKIYYQWQKIEQDAVFSLVSQDDFLWTTNFSGHVTGAKYQITDSIQLHLWALISQRDNPDRMAGQTRQTQWRLRSDVNIKF